MKEPSIRETFEILCLQAGDEGREAILFGDSISRVRKSVPPFLIGRKFPEIYFEFPLAGDPFLDATILYSDLEPGMRIDSPAAGNCGALLDWYANLPEKHANICFGFELDTSLPELPLAAVHFQPRSHTKLAMAFCELVGESELGRLFTEQAEHMPAGWPLSFFGCFRRRQDSPLRICGYLGTDEKDDCAADPSRIRAAFDNIGFSAYNRQMCTQIAEVFQIAPSAVDFQFDLYPDGRLGDVFAVDIAVPERSAFSLRKTFTDGPMAALMDHLKSRKLADGRVQLIRDSILVREVPVECDDDEEAGFLLSYRPKWIKIRWKSASMQQAKCYSLLEGRRIEGKDPEDMKRVTDI